jgi:hypothetical protein
VPVVLNRSRSVQNSHLSCRLACLRLSKFDSVSRSAIGSRVRAVPSRFFQLIRTNPEVRKKQHRGAETPELLVKTPWPNPEWGVPPLLAGAALRTSSRTSISSATRTSFLDMDEPLKTHFTCATHPESGPRISPDSCRLPVQLLRIHRINLVSDSERAWDVLTGQTCRLGQQVSACHFMARVSGVCPC